MKALYLENTVLELRDVELPKPASNQALVKVKMAGICNTDIELVKGYMGFNGILGHEFVGVVEESSQPELIGKRVCGEINLGCGRCDYCSKGLSRHCPNRSVLGIVNQAGVFAEYVAIPNENLQIVPDSISNEAAVFVEPIAAAFEILEQVHIQPDQRIAVIGDGKLGLLICQVLKLTCAELILVGKHESKLELARSFGINAIPKDKQNLEKFDIVVEASGSPTGFSTAMSLVRPRGTFVLKSTFASNLEINAAPIVIDEINIVGSRCGQFKPAIRALEQNQVQTSPLVDSVYPFEKVLEAFERAKSPGTLKVLLQLDD